ncbi:MAG: HAD family hydrolase [Candidatus Omnitrophica bacterium]|nr:HAD family hydrolase [Candidatus Omnitrophota bacterium]
MKKLFIFDLDGTLADAYDAIYDSLNFTRNRLGYPVVPYQTVKESVGKGDRLFIDMFFAEKDRTKALTIYRRHHLVSLTKKAKPQPHARGVLGRLKRRGKAVSIASNRPTAYTLVILKRLNFLKYIDFILCADKIKTIKPDPAILLKTLAYFKLCRRHAVFIGDMAIDMETARRARMDAVFIKGGSSRPKEIKEKYPGVPVLSGLNDIFKVYE